MYASQSYFNSACFPSSGSYAPSSLERIVTSYVVDTPVATVQMYMKSPSGYKNYSSIAEGQPALFLNPSRPLTPFVGEVSELIEQVGDAFALTTRSQLPSDILITIAPRDQLIQHSIEFLSNSVVGLSLSLTREIFVVSGSLAEVMLTIGHELGHIIKPAARTSEEEEAKAFAFEAAWAKTIFEHDVGGLRSSINSSAFAPARNGLHDVAFNFVRNNSDIEPLQLFDSISRGNIAQQQVIEGMQLQPATATIKPLLYSNPPQNKTKLNKSRVQNLPPPHNLVTLNGQLLRKDIEQMHKTMCHEYSLHHAMGLPDGYVVEALEEAMFWTGDCDDRYGR